MYDLQIIVPCVKSRLKIFQKFGLSNVGDSKVLVYCLVSDKKDFLEGWPENVDVEFIESVEENPCQKVYGFLRDFTPDQCKNAKWTLKIDDDSYNDLHNMKKYLDEYYDYQKDFYLVGEIRHENDYTEIEILKKMNLWKNKYQLSGWQHEFEACIISSCAMEKIIQNKKCKELFSKRSEQPTGVTDQCLGLAASFCKIYPTLTSLILSIAYRDDLRHIAYSFEERHDENVAVNKRIHFVHCHPIKQEQYLDLLEIIEIENSIKQIKEKYKLLKENN